MKKVLFFVVVLIFFFNTKSQTKDTTYWKLGGLMNVSYSQTYLKYWSAGGNNSQVFNGILNLFANYSKNSISWKNTLDMGYGTQKVMGLPFRKIDDKIDFSSKFGYKTVSKFYITGLLNFKSQFDNGFNYLKNGDSTLSSKFMAPGYLTYSLGIDYIPSNDFSVYASFLTGKTTFVLYDSLSKIGAFGVDTGKNVRFELGASIKIEYRKKITDNFTLMTKTVLFSNYLKNPQNIDIDFTLLGNYKLWKYLSLTFQLQTIYDDDILVLVDENTGRMGKRLQIKQMFGLGLSYTF